MPHLTVEFADTPKVTYQISGLLEELCEAAKKSPIVKFDGLKVRAIPLKIFRVGDANEPFVHISLKMMSGPSLRDRQALSDAVFEIATNCFPDVRQVTVSFDVTDPDTYRKR